MENATYLIEQIESYIDQLNLLGMQEQIDQARIDRVGNRVKELAREYEALLDKQAETQIQKEESVYAKTIEEEREKRKKIFLIMENKMHTLNRLFFKIFQIKVADDLQDHIRSIIKSAQRQAVDYAKDLELVDTQLVKIKNALEEERQLESDQKQASIAVTDLKDSQISYGQLDSEIVALYIIILHEGNIDQINFVNVQDKKKALKKRQDRFLENLALARSATGAEEYITMYEERVRKGKLELDKLEEQTFLSLLKKLSQASITDYESLRQRTETIQGLVASRIAQVERLYQEGVIEKDKYGTLASKIDHSNIYSQLKSLEEIKRKEELIASIKERLLHTRDHIKGKNELETIFAERAKERGRVAIIPKLPEILFDDEEIERPPKKRRQVMSIKPAKVNLLEKLKRVKGFLLSTLKKWKSVSKKAKENMEDPITYSPTIGDKIELGANAQIYSDPMNVIAGKNGKDATSANLHGVELFITRGAIFDYTGTPIYITGDYGESLEMVAKNMNLVPGTYNIVLGCSTGDANGNFIVASMDKLNPDIEKGWIRATESDLVVINKPDKEKGGIVK